MKRFSKLLSRSNKDTNRFSHREISRAIDKQGMNVLCNILDYNWCEYIAFPQVMDVSVLPFSPPAVQSYRDDDRTYYVLLPVVPMRSVRYTRSIC
jgi:hypothetical protein